MPTRDRMSFAHPLAATCLQDLRDGAISRREFLTRVTALGLSAPMAYAALGPSGAQAQPSAPEPVMGGTLRMQMLTRATKDPVTWDWLEIGNFCRGWLEYMVEYQPDGSLRGMLLEAWESNADATRWRLTLRRGVTWNNGDPFTTEDVVHNLRRWCDQAIAGNAMASRFANLADPATGKMDEYAVEIVDDHHLIVTTRTPDIALIVNMADFPSAIVHRSFVTGEDPAQNPIGTGPYLPDFTHTDAPQTLVRNPDHHWWGSAIFGGPYLDMIQYIDLGTNPDDILQAAEQGLIDATDQTSRNYIDLYDAIGWERSQAVTAATVVIRFNQNHPPYDNRDVRRALQMAVDNAVILEIGLRGFGDVAENHHVCPIQPDYAAGVTSAHDPAGALALLTAAGHAETEFELISLDDDYQAATCDAVAAQLRDAGIKVRRTILPGPLYWDHWRDHPFSATEWAMLPLGVQTMTIAYRTGAAWNETGFSNPDFDAGLVMANAIADAGRRKAVMARLQQILLDEAVMIQPYWRSLCRHVRPGLHGMEQRPTNDHLHSRWWREAVDP